LRNVQHGYNFPAQAKSSKLEGRFHEKEPEIVWNDQRQDEVNRNFAKTSDRDWKLRPPVIPMIQERLKQRSREYLGKEASLMRDEWMDSREYF